jgi:hypothetical protein
LIGSELTEEPEDVTGAAGWMFSDMLIALMVVFLATITFIPQIPLTGNSTISQGAGGDLNLPGGATYSYTERFEQEFVFTYRFSELGLVLDDISLFLNNYGLPADSVIDSAQFVGGYDEGESTQIGIQRAIDFANALEQLAPDLFARAATVLNTSSQLPADLVTLRLTFSARISTN